ncbi:MAG: helix-turn-helix domain-containing protein [Thermodesulfovibrionales bacterium]
MVVNKITLHLMEIGFSEYEARTYVALLGNNPATAYELARTSGVPSSKIYQVLAKLLERGVASALGEEGTKRYVPLEPGEFIEGHRSRTEATLKSLKQELTSVGKEAGMSYIWNIGDYGYLMDKAARMIRDARETILLSVWPEEAAALASLLKEAERRKVRIAAVHFGAPALDAGQVFPHPIEDTLYAEKGGRGLVLVVDAKEVLMGTLFEDDRVEGAWSMNRGFVALAEDYMKHDIYIMKIVQRFDGDLIRRFGARYAKLRDIFRNEEES